MPGATRAKLRRSAESRAKRRPRRCLLGFHTREVAGSKPAAPILGKPRYGGVSRCQEEHRGSVNQACGSEAHREGYSRRRSQHEGPPPPPLDDRGAGHGQPRRLRRRPRRVPGRAGRRRLGRAAQTARRRSLACTLSSPTSTAPAERHPAAYRARVEKGASTAYIALEEVERVDTERIPDAATDLSRVGRDTVWAVPSSMRRRRWSSYRRRGARTRRLRSCGSCAHRSQAASWLVFRICLSNRAAGT